MSGAALHVDKLEAPFGDQPGVEDVSFEVSPGERFAVVGRSGAGKTTILRAIAGLGHGVARAIEVAGRDVRHLPAPQRNVVYLHQTPLLFPHLSVANNVAFPLRVRGMGRAAMARPVSEVLAAMRLGDLADRRPHTLSGGQRHRVALARAIVARPAVLLLDEPFAALDPALRHDVREAVRLIQHEYRPALVFVTHDLDEAGMLADRIGVLLGRRLAQVAPPVDLFAHPATLDVALFLGLQNRVAGVMLADGRFDSPLGRLPIRSTVRAGPACALFRLDALRITADGPLGARVLELRHRVHQSTAIVELGGTRLEVSCEGTADPRPDTMVRLSVCADRLAVYSVS